jgi:hypothetical protein
MPFVHTEHEKGGPTREKSIHVAANIPHALCADADRQPAAEHGAGYRTHVCRGHIG